MTLTNRRKPSSRGAGSSRGRAPRRTTAMKKTVQKPSLSYSSLIETDALVAEYQHDKSKPREAEALFMLRKIASLVKPIMRNRGWKIHRLCEFHTPNLLGLNQRYGSNIKIFLRLRHNGDSVQFLPLDQITDTMLHELAHIVVGPHNAQFHALWNQLRDELTELVMKGYTGEGFMSKGHRLGGGLARVPPHEARRRALAAAQRRQALTAGSGKRLGGTPVERTADMRDIIAGAVERRLNITQGCASGTAEGDQAAEDALVNGSRTKAEVDDADERAIMEALNELMEEDNKASLHRSSTPGTLDGFVSRTSVPKTTNVYRPSSITATSSLTLDHTGIIDLESEPCEKNEPEYWSCAVCTLRNPSQYLACDACGSERPHRNFVQPTEQPRFTPVRRTLAEAVPKTHAPKASQIQSGPSKASHHVRTPLPKTARETFSSTASSSAKPELSIQKRALQSLKTVEDSLSSRPMAGFVQHAIHSWKRSGGAASTVEL
ncbi:hypothetical protein KEM56_002406 [Ascosphaera pollenicola]|nr:hypothetical protein KEM56_002406 [Ascosphaera pollenicola]